MQYSTIPFEINWPTLNDPHPHHQVPFCFELGSLLDYLGRVTDLRAKRGRLYPLLPCLAIALLAKLMGQNQVRDLADWAKWRAAELAEWLGLERNTMPHHTTWSRLLGKAIDPHQLEQVVGQFMADHLNPQIAGRGEVVLAIDGKTLRGTLPAGSRQGST